VCPPQGEGEAEDLPGIKIGLYAGEEREEKAGRTSEIFPVHHLIGQGF
jgi:hypothetical protein